MATLGNITKAYVSALDSLLDTREINRHVSDIYNEDALTDILGWADRKLPTKQPFYSTYVNESLFKHISPSSVSNNTSTRITLVLSTATSGITKVQDELKFTNNTVGVVRSVTTASSVDTVVVDSVSGANLVATASDLIAVFSIGMGERSDAPANERFGVTRYFNKYQIFSIVSQITDVQNASTLEVEFNGQAKYVVKDHIEKAVKQKGQINAAFWGGDMSNTSFSDANPALVDQNIVSGGGGGGPTQFTRGIDKYIELYGISAAAAAYGTNTVSLADFGAMADFLTAARAPKDYLVVGGTAARRSCDDLLKNLGSSGVTSVRLVVDGRELDFAVDKVSYSGYQFNFATMPILDHPILFSQTIIAKSLYYIPYNKQVKVLGGGFDPSIRVRYVPNQSKFGNEMIGEAHSGALSPVNPTGHVKEWKMEMFTYQGLEVLGAQWFARQRVRS
jgi:hypothetical protein